MRPNYVTESQQGIFLASLESTGLVHTAATVAGISMYELQQQRILDPALEAAMDEAMQRFNDTLEAEAIRRARDGVERDVWYKGSVVGTERVYSDALMAKLLEGRRASVYGKKAEITGPGGGELIVNIKTFDDPTATLQPSPQVQAAQIQATHAIVNQAVSIALSDDDDKWEI